MTLRWIEGFERGGDETILSRKYPGALTSATNSSIALNDGFSSPSGNYLTSLVDTYQSPPVVGSASNDWIFGFAYRPGNTGASPVQSGGIAGIGLANADGEQVRVQVANAASSAPQGEGYQLQIVRGSTVLATSNEVFPARGLRRWIYFEFKITVGDTGSVEGRYYDRKQKNGIQMLSWDNSLASVDTQEQSSTGADSIVIHANSGSPSSTHFDDIYLCDTAGTRNNDYLGPVAITAIDVSGDGDTTQWELTGGATSTEDAWNEPENSQSLAEDDKRLKSQSTGAIHLATLDDVELVENVTIHGIAYAMHARMETSGSLVLHHRFRKTTGTPAESEAGSHTVTSTSISCGTSVQEEDPNTGAPWVVADIDGLQLGVRRD